MQGRLIVQSGEELGTIYPLDRAVITIGRGEDVDIVLANEYASRRHAQVTWDGRQYILQDLNSKNGTFLNGQRLTDPRPLRHRDLIIVAGVTLAFRTSEETLTAPPGAPAAPNIRVDTTTAEVWVHNRQVQVTAKEYLALALLCSKQGALVSKDELAGHVWPEYQGAVGDENIEQLISRLRRKLEEEPGHPRHLITVRGLGYRLISSAG